MAHPQRTESRAREKRQEHRSDGQRGVDGHRTREQDSDLARRTRLVASHRGVADLRQDELGVRLARRGLHAPDDNRSGDGSQKGPAEHHGDSRPRPRSDVGIVPPLPEGTHPSPQRAYNPTSDVLVDHEEGLPSAPHAAALLAEPYLPRETQSRRSPTGPNPWTT